MKIMPGAEPLKIENGRRVALLIHGFSSSPQEVRELGKYLSKRGWTVDAPLLIGHGTQPSDLKNIKYQQWYDQLEKRILHYKKQNRPISLIGVSLGGCLAFHLAAVHDIQCVISVGTPVYFHFGRVWRVFLPLIRWFKTYHRKRFPKRHLHALKNRVHYKEIPVKSIYQVFRGIKCMKKSLSKVSCPTLILQSDDDAILKAKSAYYLYKNIKSKNKRIEWVSNSYHVVLLDRLKSEVFKKINSFLVQ